MLSSNETEWVTSHGFAAIAVVAILGVDSGTARADLGDDEAAPPPVAGATIDRVHDSSVAGMSVAYTRLAREAPHAEATNMRLDLHAQYVSRQGGIYGALHASRLSGDPQESESSVGSAELGGVYVARTLGLPVLLRAGFVLPTSSDQAEGVTAETSSHYPRLTDLSLVYSDVTWVRLCVSPLVRQGRFVARGDFGLDVPLDQGWVDPSFVEPWGQVDSLVRFNVAAGADLDVVSIMGELVTVGATGWQAEWISNRFFHTLAVTGRGRLRGIEPYLSAIFPVDAPPENQDWGASWVVMVGVDATER